MHFPGSGVSSNPKKKIYITKLARQIFFILLALTSLVYRLPNLISFVHPAKKHLNLLSFTLFFSLRLCNLQFYHFSVNWLKLNINLLIKNLIEQENNFNNQSLKNKCPWWTSELVVRISVINLSTLFSVINFNF